MPPNTMCLIRLHTVTPRVTVSTHRLNVQVMSG